MANLTFVQLRLQDGEQMAPLPLPQAVDCEIVEHGLV